MSGKLKPLIPEIMKLSIILWAGLLLSGLKPAAQVVYVDLLTAPAMTVYAKQLEEQQQETNKNLSAIQKTQLLIQTQLAAANSLQKKIHTGLSEVSQTVSNAVTVKRIYETSQDILDELQEATQLAAENPAYTIFARESAESFRLRAVEMSAEVTRVLTGGETNLMDAGERQKLLNYIYTEIRLLYGAAYGITHSIRWAVRRGFWKSMLPFSGWVNQDSKIMREVMAKAQNL